MIGNANSSARARSLPTCVLTCAHAIAPPPSFDVALTGELALQARRVVLDSQVRLRLEVRDDIGRAPVAGDHRRVVAVVVARDRRDVATRAQLRLDLPHAPLGCSRCGRRRRSRARRRQGRSAVRSQPGSDSSPGPTGSKGRCPRTGSVASRRPGRRRRLRRSRAARRAAPGAGSDRRMTCISSNISSSFSLDDPSNSRLGLSKSSRVH